MGSSEPQGTPNSSEGEPEKRDEKPSGRSPKIFGKHLVDRTEEYLGKSITITGVHPPPRESKD